MRAARLTCWMLAICLSACATAEDMGESIPLFDGSAAFGGADAGLGGSGLETGQAGSGGSGVSAGGTAPSAGGSPPSAGGAPSTTGGASSGGASSGSTGGSSPAAGAPSGGAGTQCGATEKRCNGTCTVKGPTNGCDAADCTACAAAPANGYLKCGTSGACEFDCLLGFQKTADGTGCQQQGGGTGGSGGATGGQCVENQCPDCTISGLLGTKCCKSATACGCKPLLGLLPCG